MESMSTLPYTGGFFSTDGIIVLIVAIIFILGYILFCILRENKQNDLKEFSNDDFVDDDQGKQ